MFIKVSSGRAKSIAWLLRGCYKTEHRELLQKVHINSGVWESTDGFSARRMVMKPDPYASPDLTFNELSGFVTGMYTMKLYAGQILEVDWWENAETTLTYPDFNNVLTNKRLSRSDRPTSEHEVCHVTCTPSMLSEIINIPHTKGLELEFGQIIIGSASSDYADYFFGLMPAHHIETDKVPFTASSLSGIETYPLSQV